MVPSSPGRLITREPLARASDSAVVGVAGSGGQDLAARVAEVPLPVELADGPRVFPTGTVDGPHEIAVGDGVCGLFQLPKVFRQPGDGRRGVEDDFGAYQAQAACPFGEVAVEADVDADLGKSGLEHRGAEVAGREV